MTNRIYPCLWFDDQAGEAAELYCSLFKGAKLTLNTPMVVHFEIYGKKIMGLNGGPRYRINPSISLFVLCESKDETNRVWDKLIEGGRALMPIGHYFWSERYGWLQDKYGVTWQISVVNKPGDPTGITPSMLFTGNQFGRAAEAIGFYSKLFEHAETTVMIRYPETDPHAGKVMFSEFTLNGSTLIAMDGPGEHAYTFNEGVSLVVDCADQEEVDHYWKGLTAGGGQEGRCGWLKDPFGVSWQIVPRQLGGLISSPEKEKAGRAIQAMLKMKKIIIRDLQQAYNGS